MEIRVFDDKQELARTAAAIFAVTLREKPDAVLGLATGSTPEDTYAALVRMYKEGTVDFSRAVSFNLDEYVGLPEDHSQSYHTFMKEHLFSLVNIRPENTHIPGAAYGSGAAYDEAIAAAGGIDLQLLGIGENGHIGFNEPASYLALGTHIGALTESTREANARFFEKTEDVPKYAMTMGMGSIMKAKKILLLALGEKKRDAIARMRDGLVTTEYPATLLKLHPDVVVLCDRAAYGE